MQETGQLIAVFAQRKGTVVDNNLRVRFAKAMGYVYVTPVSIGINPTAHRLVWEKGMPHPTDSNTVREAMMGMTGEEWEKFCWSAARKAGYRQTSHWHSTLDHMFVKNVLKLEPTTLAELICEVRGIP